MQEYINIINELFHGMSTINAMIIGVDIGLVIIIVITFIKRLFD